MDNTLVGNSLFFLVLPSSNDSFGVFNTKTKKKKY